MKSHKFTITVKTHGNRESAYHALLCCFASRQPDNCVFKLKKGKDKASCKPSAGESILQHMENNKTFAKIQNGKKYLLHNWGITDPAEELSDGSFLLKIGEVNQRYDASGHVCGIGPSSRSTYKEIP